MFEVLANRRIEVVLIGGSAGSFPVVNTILEYLPSDYSLPVVLCLHRLRDKREGFREALEIKSRLPVLEPNDKDTIVEGNVYLAPSNYHLLIENPYTFALSTTELVQFSRPSIDVLFESAADAWGPNVLAIVLSGANRDGAFGMKWLKRKGGFNVVQDPKTCTMPTMPEACIGMTEIDLVLDVTDIISLLLQLHEFKTH
jgi:two-component system, chemotaxis family, protein-glutamate methylesterase/glutaminase